MLGGPILGLVILKNAMVSLDGTDVSAYVEAIDLDFAAQPIDNATTDDDTAVVVAGRKDWALRLDAIQDFTATTGLDAVLWGLKGASVSVQVRPVNAAESTGNPTYSGSALLTNYKPLFGSHGEQARTPIVFRPLGALTRSAVAAGGGGDERILPGTWLPGGNRP